jgi:hypothetical protein
MAPVTQPLQETLDAHHEFIQATAKEIVDLRKQLADLTARLTAIPQTPVPSPQPPKRALRRAVEDLGCRPNDPKFDNAALLQPVLDQRIGIEFDVGGLYYTSPLKTRPGAASPLVGASAGFRHVSPSMTGLAPFTPDQTHLLEITGVAGQAAVPATPTTPAVPEVIGGAGLVHSVRDLYFLGNPKCDGLRIHGGHAISVERCIFRECNRGVLIQPTIAVYSPRIAGCGIYGCDTGLQVENGTSVCCLDVSATPIIGGRLGIVQTGWKRGAVYTGVVLENQAEEKLRLVDSRAKLSGCYLEAESGKVGLYLRGSRVAIEDSSIGYYYADQTSQITWLGDNLQAGTMARPT